ncbi:MAG: hypothetical protein AAF753_11900 [Pseudomonadota bacterium]
MSVGGAWLTAAVLSAVGITLLLAADAPLFTVPVMDWGTFASLFALRMGFLALVQALFLAYNRLNPAIRYLVYPFLQLGRLGGYVLLASTNIVGMMLISAVVIGRWIPYSIYRLNKVRWYKPERVFIVQAFVLSVPFALSVDAESLISLQFLVALVLLTVRAARAFGELI